MAASPSLKWLLPLFLTLFLSSLYPSSSSMFTTDSSFYTDHCGSIVPESAPTNLFGSSNSFHISNGNFFSSNDLLNQLLYPSYNSTPIPTSAKTFFFKPIKVHQTLDTSILKIEGTLVLLGSWVPQNKKSQKMSSYEDKRRKVIFKLWGFWSESVGKLCMVGTGKIQLEGLFSPVSAVLKLEYPKVSNIKTSIVRGRIESLDSSNSPTHFEPISLLAYAQNNYEYTLIDQAKESCSLLPNVEKSIAMEGNSFCSTLQSISHSSLSFQSHKLMNFIGFDLISMNHVDCFGDGRVHISMSLSNESTYSYDGRPFIPGKSLVAEGVWDDRRNKLCILACKLNQRDDSLASSSVGDCSIGFSFWFPSTFSLKKRSTIVGNMWNIKETNNNGYNKVIDLSSIGNRNLVVPELKYEFTELETARKYCKASNVNQNIKEYPNVKSFNDMMFSLRMRDINGRSSWGSARQVSVGEIYYGNPNGNFNDRRYMSAATTEPYNLHSDLVDQNSATQNVGYEITYSIGGKRTWVEISAEGIYDSNTGMLCLVGCILPNYMKNYRFVEDAKARADDNITGCEVFIQLQLAPVTQNAYTNEKESGKGVIKSTRDPSDPLYFSPIKITSSPMTTYFSSEEFRRINLELVMVVISLTLLCIFTYFQLRHARKHPKIRPMMSILMLIILTLGHVMPLILNIEDLLTRKKHHSFFFQSGGWPEAKNAIMRFITLIGLFIQIRVVQLRWKSRTTLEGITPCGVIWKAEIASLLLCVPLYLSGAVLAWFFHSNISKINRTLWEDLTRYSGLVLDSFLLPQIVFNFLFNGKERILTPFFYGGITAVRVAPHIYDAYRTRRFFDNISSSNIYASHDDDYYSAILDVVIPCEGLLFVVLIYLQQRFGGRCFLPKRFKQGEGYELVPQECNI